jgi:hypothetical protein
MKKLLLTLTVLCGIISGSLAQTTTTSTPVNSVSTGTRFSIGAEAGLPVGQASDGFSTVLGGSAKLELPTSSRAYFTLSAGFNAFLLKSEFKGLGIPSTVNFIPIKAGFKYYSDGGFFMEGQAGIVFSTEDGGGHAFVWSPGIGYSFNNGFEAGVRYEAWVNDGTVGQMSLRLAYRFQ